MRDLAMSPHRDLKPDNEDAFASLAGLADLPGTDLLWLDRCPVFDAMRSDPRFSEARAAVAARVAELWS